LRFRVGQADRQAQDRPARYVDLLLSAKRRQSDPNEPQAVPSTQGALAGLVERVTCFGPARHVWRPPRPHGLAVRPSSGPSVLVPEQTTLVSGVMLPAYSQIITPGLPR